ncbi:hypothetical protein [Desulfolutivibrio sp.]|uniref:hypothetical protein n=1 Tax=Desulfolutivibrio sp. TaxID=2773296 RepID=UPI002F969941
MSASLDELMQAVRQMLSDMGWRTEIQQDRVVAVKIAIAFKWMLGKRTVRQDVECRFDAQENSVRFTETATESSIGIPPLSFGVTKHRQSGTRYREKRVEKGIGGQGAMSYGTVGESVMRLCQEKGYRFVCTTGRIKNPLK